MPAHHSRDEGDWEDIRKASLADAEKKFKGWYERTYNKDYDLTDTKVAEIHRAFVAGHQSWPY